MENLNLVELLRDCPTGMELDCAVFDNITFDYVNTEQNRIYCKIDNRDTAWFTAKGCINLTPSAKCVIFPKGKTTWEGFVSPCKFKNGDVISAIVNKKLWYGIYQKEFNAILYCYVSYSDATEKIYPSSLNGMCFIGDILEIRFATEEEKQKLFDAIKANGYKWNAETKTLEKLVKPIFKINNVIRHKERKSNIRIVDIKDGNYIFENGDKLPIYLQNDYEFITDKFDIRALKPFDKVLVRDDDRRIWEGSFFSCYYSHFYICAGGDYRQCIPYKGNEHLLGNNDDCDDFYKTWENNN